MKNQVEDYRRLNRYNSKVIITDKINGNREKQQWLKELGIRYSGKPVGRPSSKSQTAYQRRKFLKEQGMRNKVEGKFGLGKNGYNLSKVKSCKDV